MLKGSINHPPKRSINSPKVCFRAFRMNHFQTTFLLTLYFTTTLSFILESSHKSITILKLFSLQFKHFILSWDNHKRTQYYGINKHLSKSDRIYASLQGKYIF